MKVDFITLIIFADCLKKRYHLTPSEYRCTCLKLLSADPSLQTHK